MVARANRRGARRKHALKRRINHGAGYLAGRLGRISGPAVIWCGGGVRHGLRDGRNATA